jgi:TetR/AcrR family transcriptional regulator
MTKPTKLPDRRAVSPKAVSPKTVSPKTASGASRNDILDAALKVFARDTFEGASLQEIAQIANIGQPLVHYHFGGKDNLWRAAIEYALGDLKKFYEAVAITTVDLEPIDTIRVLCRAFLQFSSRCPEHILIVINEMRSSGERFDWLVENYIKPVHKGIDALIESAIARGQMKPIPPAYVTNTMFVALVHFFTIAPLLKSVYEIDTSDPAVIAAHANFARQIIFDGIKA